MSAITRLPTAVELFAGGGGMSTGIEHAGFDLRAVAELDPDVAEVHRLNHPRTKVLSGQEGDVSRLRGRDLLAAAGVEKGELGALAAGPPCQGYSSNGKRDPRDKRNALWRHVVRLVGETEPRVAVVENVVGMATLSGGRFLQALVDGFSETGYRATVLRLNAADYGVPQDRRRIFVVASRDGRETRVPPPAPASVGVWEAIADLPEVATDQEPGPARYRGPPRSAYAAALRGDAETVLNCEVTLHSPGLLAKIGPLRFGEKDPSTRHRRLHPRRPSPTLLAGAKTITACRPIHPYKDRVVTVREGARLFGYPDAYRFAQTIQKSWYVLGNSVPPPLAKAVFSQVLAAHIGGAHRGRALQSCLPPARPRLTSQG